jgi:hypothetical protein
VATELLEAVEAVEEAAVKETAMAVVVKVLTE